MNHEPWKNRSLAEISHTGGIRPGSDIAILQCLSALPVNLSKRFKAEFVTMDLLYSMEVQNSKAVPFNHRMSGSI